MNSRNISEMFQEKFWIARPLETITEDYDNIRFNVVTDGISKRWLFGEEATPLILASFLCKKNGWTLRLITRGSECNLRDFYEFAELYDLEIPDKIESYSDRNAANDLINYRLPISDKDVFMATSWWSAKSILDSNITNKILYIIQEEETCLYPYGDKRLLCEMIMHDPRIDFIVNSSLLFTYMKNAGYDTLVKNGMFFEPSFPKKLFEPDENTFQKKNKYTMFFYGRPSTPSSLYYMGLACLDEALKRGIIDTDLWDICLTGDDTEGIRFTNGYEPIMKGSMLLGEYAAFARTVDLSFSLMYSPHPSYPPFDMLCSGAVVLTNEFKNKKNLQYSNNMILAKLDIEDICEKMKNAVSLAYDVEKRKLNYENNRIERDWNTSFKDIISALEERIVRGDYV